MTRQQIAQFAQAFLAEDVDAGELDPVLFGMNIDTAANEICRATDCFYLDWQTSLVQGQQAYCAPPLYKLKAVSAVISDGSTRLLRPATPAQLDSQIRSWRADPGNGNNPATGNPSFYVVRGLNSIWLAPTAGYSLGSGAAANATLIGESIGQVNITNGGSGYLNPPGVVIADPTGSCASAHAILTNGVVTQVIVDVPGQNYTAPMISFPTYGLTFEGYGVPEDGGQSLWPNPGDQCPLPTRAHEAVGYRAAILRCISKFAATKDASVLQVKAMLEKEYAKAKGYVEVEAARYSSATRFRESNTTRFHRRGSSWSFGSW